MNNIDYKYEADKLYTIYKYRNKNNEWAENWNKIAQLNIQAATQAHVDKETHTATNWIAAATDRVKDLIEAKHPVDTDAIIALIKYDPFYTTYEIEAFDNLCRIINFITEEPITEEFLKELRITHRTKF